MTSFFSFLVVVISIHFNDKLEHDSFHDCLVTGGASNVVGPHVHVHTVLIG